MVGLGASVQGTSRAVMNGGACIACAAALWAVIFAVLHTVWAAGWYIGLDQDLARQAFQKRSFLIYEMVVAAVCVLGTCVALTLRQTDESSQPLPIDDRRSGRVAIRPIRGRGPSCAQDCFCAIPRAP